MFIQNLEIINTSYTNLLNTKNTIENLKNIKDGQEILVPVGGLINLKATITEPHEILLNISNDIIIKKNIDNSIEFIDKLIGQHKEQINFLQEQIKKIDVNLQGISQKLKR